MKISSFEIIKNLGQGGYGNVYLAKYSDDSCDNVANNQLVALKVINKKNNKSIMKEIEVSSWIWL